MPELPLKASYTRDEVRRMLPISERQLKGWERHGLIPPLQTFSFSDLIALRALMKLHEDKVPPRTIRSIFLAVRTRIRDITDPLKQIKVIAEGKRIRVEVNGHRMEPMSGQLLFNFDGEALKRLLSFPEANAERESRKKKETAERLFQQGLEQEQRGAIEDALQSYQAAVGLDEHSAGAWLNLGTIHFNARQFGRAEFYYKKALIADPTYALAHFNVANLYDERGDHVRALNHYREAVRLNPSYADAYYNLALLFQGSGQTMEAVRHWKYYLKLDPGSSWSAVARRELEKLRKSTVVQGARATKRVSYS